MHRHSIDSIEARQKRLREPDGFKPLERRMGIISICAQCQRKVANEEK